jgi:uncharacterized protein YndB with AHSA1/START domain
MTMNDKSQPPLAIRRTINATPERVFEAFAKQEQMDKWMCRDAASHVIKYLTFDFRVGGGFTLEIAMPGGERYLQLGTYKQIDHPEKIVFLWEGEHYSAAGERIAELRGTVVTFEFLRHGNATELILTHDFLPNEDEFKNHKGGWNGCIDMLMDVVAGE